MDSEAATHFADVKTDSAMFYKAATRFARVKTDSPKRNKAATPFAEVKTDSPKLYKAATPFSEVQRTLRSSTVDFGSLRIPVRPFRLPVIQSVCNKVRAVSFPA